MKTKFSSDDDLPLNTVLKFHILTVTIRNVFEKYGKYYPRTYLDDCLYKVQMLEYDISEGIDLNKSNKSKEWDICHYWYFLDKNFKYELYFCKWLSRSNAKSYKF